MLIHVAPLRVLVRETFVAAGCAEDEAERISLYLVNANLTGHDSHGVIRVPRYLQWMREGGVKPGQAMTVVSENEVMAVLDGNYGFGQTIGPLAVQKGIDKAKASGVSIVALRHSGHLGRIGEWAEMAAAAGQVSIHFVNVAGSLLVAPFGGTERRMSTNPVAIGVPLPDQEPLVLDFATSIVAEGKVMVALEGGKPLPPGSLIDDDGALTTDPKIFYGIAPGESVPDPRKGGGAIRAMGEHKGSGLSFMCEMLAGALTGSSCAGPGPRQLCNGMLSIYLETPFFDSDHGFAAEARHYVEFFKSANPAKAGGEVLVPGEPERQRRRQRLAEGIPIPEDTWKGILEGARSAGMDQAAIDKALGATSA